MKKEQLYKVLGGFNKVKLAVQTTPLQRLNNIEKIINIPNIYIKRDDLNGLGPGGNKVRNLEYLLGDAIKSDCDLIIASGYNESNLCMLAAAACTKLGLECVLVHNSCEPQVLKGNMLLNGILGIKQIYLGDVDETSRSAHAQKLKHEYISKGRRPYIIYNGATSPMGSLGYVDGALELFNQIGDTKISDVFVPGGNGGLATGMIFGAGALDMPFHVNVISVENEKEKLYKIISDLIGELEELTNIKLKYGLDEMMTVYEDYRGDGWNCETAESVNMIYELARKEGIFLEKVYTSKAFFGMKDLLEKKIIKCDGACYLHSGGFSSLFDQF